MELYFYGRVQVDEVCAVAQICNRKVSTLVPKKFKIVPKKFKNSAEKIQNSAEKIQK